MEAGKIGDSSERTVTPPPLSCGWSPAAATARGAGIVQIMVGGGRRRRSNEYWSLYPSVWMADWEWRMDWEGWLGPNCGSFTLLAETTSPVGELRAG